MTRLRLSLAVAWLVGWGAICGASAAETPAELAKKVEAIFRQHCYRCHGEGGKAESELYVLDRESLVPKRVTPGTAGKSLLLAKIRSGEMPSDKDPLSQADQDTIRQWIDAGAVDFAPAKAARKFISPADTFIVIAADLKRIEQTRPDDLAFTRYFTITHLYNGLSTNQVDDQLATYRNALSKLINSLSWGRKVKAPRAVDPQQTLFAIDLRDYKWNESVWNAIVAQNPYSVKYDSVSAKYGYQVTGTELPVVRGDWFVAAASRPPLYHEILYDRTVQIPDPNKAGYDRQLEKFLKVDVEENLRTKRVARAGFNRSGVSQNNRLLERHESDLTNGAYWKSYDFAGNEGRKNLFGHPLGPTGPNAFDQDGGEIIFNLPNGLQAYLLVDAKGKRIDKGPTNVVSDPVQKDRAVVNGLSCMSCHVQGMIRKPDEIREHVQQNQGSFTASEVKTVLALYPTAKTFEDLQQEDADRFAKAVKETGAPVGKQEPIVQLALRFEAELTAKLTAAELGLTVEDFLKGLDRSPGLSRTLGSLKVPGRTIKRDVFVSTFGSVVKDLGLGTFLARTAGSGDTNLGAPEKEYVSQSSGMKLALIPAGEFKMGSPTSEAERQDNEDPRHPVRITKSFYMGVYEVTQAEFQKVLGRNTSGFSSTGLFSERVSGLNTSRFPAENVSWFDAIEFCNKLSEADGRTPYYRLTGIERDLDQSIKTATVTIVGGNGYRLPTEAEWEYACRGNTTTPFHFGSVLNGDKANVAGTEPYGTKTQGANLGRTTAVDDAKYPKNAFGLSQMHGNVWEWCEDVYDQSAYAGRSQTMANFDPLVTSGSEYRVLRGGSWTNLSWFARSAVRVRSSPAYRYLYFGFRLVCVPLP